MNKTLQSNHLLIYYGFVSDFSVNDLFINLSKDEKSRIKKLQLKEDRNMQILSRTFLKKLLAFYSGMEIEKLILQYGLNGKLFAPNLNAIQFNISHSSGLITIALVKDDKVGIDVEQLNRNLNIHQLSNFLFTKNEEVKFKHSNLSHRKEEFINCWTRKEAVFKAMGSGISHSTNLLEVSFLKNEKAKVLSTNWSEKEIDEWFLHSFDIPGGYRGACAVHGMINAVDLIDLKTESQLIQ